MKAKAYKFCLLWLLLLILAVPEKVLAVDIVETLDVINIPDQMSLELPTVDISRELVQSAQYQAESKAVDKAFCKQFGPLELGFNVNPFNLNNAGLRFNLDIVRSLEILETTSDINRFSEAFKPEPHHNIINQEMKDTFAKIFDPKV